MSYFSVRRTTIIVGLLVWIAPPTRGADLVALSPQTWDRYAAHGKEADAIYGDFALVNDQLIAIVAHPKRGRNANMTVRDVGGCLIDLTRRERQSDQLSAYYPGAGLRELRFAGVAVEAPEVYETAELDRVFVRARRVTLRLAATPRAREPDVEVAYSLEEGRPFIEVTTAFANRGNQPVDAELVDAFRADKTFEQSPEGASPLFWIYDKYFGQAYGVSAEEHDLMGTRAHQMLVRYRDRAGKVVARLAPGDTYRLVRRIIPGANLFDVQRVASALTGNSDRSVRLTVKDTVGRAIADADVSLARGGAPLAWGRTDEKGEVQIAPAGVAGSLTITALAHGSKQVHLPADAHEPITVELPEAGAVAARIVDERGGPIPCKVQFIGVAGTPSPDFGPDSGEHAVKNLYYSHDGNFRVPLAPGAYDAIVSYGTEYDAVFARLDVVRGKEARLEAKLMRTVKTPGWISADFHSHSSPSGDNTSSQLGRVLNLLCEHVEFAPCTEHNRLSTYDPHLKRLGAERRMGTCVGIELTGSPLPLNHQNAFPLVPQFRTQDGGGPTPDADPETQIERLAFWDNASDKLVQVNHPDIGWMFRDRNGDGDSDTGFAGMAGRMDVIEVHPPHTIFGEATAVYNGTRYNNTIFNWLQLLNQGKRIPGVVNTDAHYNFHGSGWLRTYLKSPTDDPAEVKTLDMVHAAERGHSIMTNGPFLEVTLRAGDSQSAEAVPGDDLSAPGGKTTLHVRVQCPNWFDVDRVQVFLNGRPDGTLNITRKATPARFESGTLKFDHEFPVVLERDTHVIVAAIGEGSRLGPVMGPDHAADLPVAVSNPIFVDVDGGGFKANGDTLGKLPVKGGR